MILTTKNHVRAIVSKAVRTTVFIMVSLAILSVFVLPRFVSKVRGVIAKTDKTETVAEVTQAPAKGKAA